MKSGFSRRPRILEMGRAVAADLDSRPVDRFSYRDHMARITRLFFLKQYPRAPEHFSRDFLPARNDAHRHLRVF